MTWLLKIASLLAVAGVLTMAIGVVGGVWHRLRDRGNADAELGRFAGTDCVMSAEEHPDYIEDLNDLQRNEQVAYLMSQHGEVASWPN